MTFYKILLNYQLSGLADPTQPCPFISAKKSERSPEYLIVGKIIHKNWVESFLNN